MKITLVHEGVDSDRDAAQAWAERSSLDVEVVVPGSPVADTDVLLLTATGADETQIEDVLKTVKSARAVGARLMVVAAGTERYDDLPADRYVTVKRLSGTTLAMLEDEIVELAQAASDNAPVVVQEQADPAVEPTKAPAARVFLSYRRPDEAAMNKVRKELEDRNYEVWWDQAKQAIPAGAFWPSSVEDAIRGSDAFVVLLSPRALEDPTQIRRELMVADEARKPIVALMTKRIPELPKGFSLILGGEQRIELYKDFAAGMDSLSERLGETTHFGESRGALRDRIAGARRKARKFARDKDIAGKLRTHGGTALAGVASAAAVALAAQQKANEKARERYLHDARDLLVKSLRDLEAPGDRFLSEFQRRIGGLEHMTPPPRLREHHARLVRDLDALSREVEELVKAGADADFENARTRLANHYADVINSAMEWLQESNDQ